MDTSERIGIGLRAPHVTEILERRPALGFVEVHSENWMTDSAPVVAQLEAIRDAYPISLHGVGLSLGSAHGLDPTHLRKLSALVERVRPVLVSEHLSWSAIPGLHSHDLLPLPYTPETVRLLCRHIDKVQQCLGRRLLVENLSSYCTFTASCMPEWAFVRAVVEGADCGLLLDLNNLYVNAYNQGFDALTYLEAMPWSQVKEIHLAGYEIEAGVLVDTHGQPVQNEVWQLYKTACKHLPASARVLIEWDTHLPALDVLLKEAERAQHSLEAQHVT